MLPAKINSSLPAIYIYNSQPLPCLYIVTYCVYYSIRWFAPMELFWSITFFPTASLSECRVGLQFEKCLDLVSNCLNFSPSLIWIHRVGNIPRRSYNGYLYMFCIGREANSWHAWRGFSVQRHQGTASDIINKPIPALNKVPSPRHGHCMYLFWLKTYWLPVASQVHARIICTMALKMMLNAAFC